MPKQQTKKGFFAGSTATVGGSEETGAGWLASKPIPDVTLPAFVSPSDSPPSRVHLYQSPGSKAESKLPLARWPDAPLNLLHTGLIAIIQILGEIRAAKSTLTDQARYLESTAQRQQLAAILTVHIASRI